MMFVMHETLYPPVVQRHAAVCEVLLRHVRHACHMHAHLHTVRGLFLMEAGDLVTSMATELFEKVWLRATRWLVTVLVRVCGCPVTVRLHLFPGATLLSA